MKFWKKKKFEWFRVIVQWNNPKYCIGSKFKILLYYQFQEEWVSGVKGNNCPSTLRPLDFFYCAHNWRRSPRGIALHPKCFTRVLQWKHHTCLIKYKVKYKVFVWILFRTNEWIHLLCQKESLSFFFFLINNFDKISKNKPNTALIIF